MSHFQVITTCYNYQYWWPFTLIITLAGTQAIIKVSGHQHGWLWPGNRTFLEVASMVVTWRIVAFLCSATTSVNKKVGQNFMYLHYISFQLNAVFYNIKRFCYSVWILVIGETSRLFVEIVPLDIVILQFTNHHSLAWVFNELKDCYAKWRNWYGEGQYCNSHTICYEYHL